MEYLMLLLLIAGFGFLGAAEVMAIGFFIMMVLFYMGV